MHPIYLKVWYIHPHMDSLIQKMLAIGDDRFLFAPFHLAHFPDNILSDSEESILICPLAEFKQLKNQIEHMGEPYPLKILLCIDSESDFQPEWVELPYLLEYLVGIPSEERFLFLLSKIYAFHYKESEIQRLSHQVNIQRKRLQELNEIGVALSTERKIDDLLDMILHCSMEITSSDAGGLYLVEKKPNTAPDKHNPLADKQLRFKLTRNLSIQVDFTEFSMDINEKSMAGFVAVTGEPLRIIDAYDIPEDAPFGFNKSFDKGAGYRSKSMLTVPMKNHQNEIIGVVQLLNKKRNWKLPLPLQDETLLNQEILSYDAEDESLLCSMASQAAVAIENTRLYQNIQHLFEGFIKASVQAIESRDPTTSGHSERVASLTVGLAEVVDQIDSGCYKYVKFSRDDIKELKYASLLHDFGKIGVREHVLVKAKKLYPHELAAIEQRFKLIRKSIQHDFSLKKLQYLMEMSKDMALEHVQPLDQELENRIMELDEYMTFILKANEPTVLEKGGFEKLHDIGQHIFKVDEEAFNLLETFEIKNLSIPRGTLNEEERLEIESHVTHTFRFLSQIPWTNELKHVPDIAYAHHEKLNGSGYPRQLREKDIPVQSKMMTISDIYDALTASDRPYKKAMPVQRALDILGFEVKDGHLDPELFQLFTEAKVYEHIQSTRD